MPVKAPGRRRNGEPALAGLEYPIPAEPQTGIKWLAASIGELLYMLGLQGEYYIVRLWRIVKDFLDFIVPIFEMVFKSIGRWFASIFKRMAADISAPFAHYKKRRSQLKRARERFKKRAAKGGKSKTGYAFFGGQLAGNFKLVLAVIGYILPVASVLAFGFTAHNLLSTDYGLAVEINGQVLGYVTDQTVVEGAKGLLRDRIQLADGQNLTDWQLDPTYTLTRTNQFSSTNQLANNILRNNIKEENDITEATGFYLDGKLYAVTTEGEQLRTFLDNYLEGFQRTAPEGASVDFTSLVECDPSRDDVFFTSSVVGYEQLVEQLSSNVTDELWAEADGVQTLAEIAEGYGLNLATLLVRNPQFAEVESDMVPEAGVSVLIRRAQPFLQVQTVLRQSSIEAMPYEVIEQESGTWNKGTRIVTQEGVEGQRQVWDDYYYVNGELDRIERIDDETVVLVEPVSQVIEIGTKEVVIGSIMTDATASSGGFVFPVPESPYSSRGIGPNHRGLDINAATGASILACSDGSVVTAEFHYSYGYYVVIDHGNGIQTLYAHCSALYVGAGQQVAAGQVIAAVGSTGNSSGPHCHLEVTVGGSLVDPVGYVGYPY